MREEAVSTVHAEKCFAKLNIVSNLVFINANFEFPLDIMTSFEGNKFHMRDAGSNRERETGQASWLKLQSKPGNKNYNFILSMCTKYYSST